MSNDTYAPFPDPSLTYLEMINNFHENEQNLFSGSLSPMT